GDAVYAHAELAALDRAELDQLLHDAASHVHRDREADADVAAGAREYRGVDPDQLAAQVHQRAAGVARIDRGVGLNEVLEAVGVDPRARQAADDPRGHGVLQTEGIADRHHEVADLGLGGVAERDLRQALGLDLENRDVGVRVAPDHFGLEITPVLERHGDLVGILHDVRIREDVTGLGVDDHARAGALERPLARATLGRRVEEAA